MRKKSHNHIETRGAAGVRAARDLLEGSGAERDLLGWSGTERDLLEGSGTERNLLEGSGTELIQLGWPGQAPHSS